MQSHYNYVLANMKDTLNELLDELNQLQEDIPEIDNKFEKIEDIKKHLQSTINKIE